jgi:hypothetical protein
MRAGHAIFTLLLSSFVCVVFADPFLLNDTIIGLDFIDTFTWWTAEDPTHGRVNYVDKDTALQKNLSYGTSPFTP